MKILLRILLSLVALVLIIFGILFFKPDLILNPKTISWVLNKTEVFKEWSWKKAEMSHDFKGVFHRNFSGEFRDFCFHLDKPSIEIQTCFEEISWNFDLSFSFKEGINTKSIRPLFVRNKNFIVIPKDAPVAKEPSQGPPDIRGYWNMLWSKLVPDADIYFEKITIKKDEPLELDLKLIKKENSLIITAMDFTFEADPKKFSLRAPPRYPIPKDLGTSRPLYLKDFILSGEMKKKGVSLHLKGFLEAVSISAESFIKLPLKGEFTSVAFKKDAILNTTAKIALTGLKESLRDYAPKPFNELPAPLNVMNGDIIVDVWSKNLEGDFVSGEGKVSVDLKSPGQIINLVVDGNVPVDVTDFSRGIIELGINFKELVIKLPRFSKKALPPQLKPDGRFKTHKEIIKPEEKTNPINIHLQALNKKALHVKSNLLDEPLRLNFDLDVKKGVVKNGFLKMLPLNTTVFKRPINVQDLIVNFDAPLTPVIDATVLFPLPEYKVTMKIEGPVDKPRYAFSSEPPLPESDIYAVLLFGRPMDDLGNDDKTAASKTNQILSRGLALSTLYFLAGSPVEYVGYDPESKNATAQFGLGEKSSLRVGGGREGVNSTAIRRSLGKGWYIDTSVQNSSTGVQSNKTKNYGVLLERIIAY